MVTAQASTLVPSLTRAIRRQLDLVPDLPARLDRPNLAGARESVAVFHECFQSLSAQVNLEKALARAIDLEALYRSFDAFVAFRAGESGRTIFVLLTIWVKTLAELRRGQEAGYRLLDSCEVATTPRPEGAEPEAEHAHLIHFLGHGAGIAEDLPAATRHAALGRPGSPVVPGSSIKGALRALSRSPDHAEWRVLFHQAVEQIIVPELGGDQARVALRSLLGRLELSQDDLGRMVGVSGETIRRWERGAIGIPAERRAEILAAEAGLRRLQELFLPERLPTVIRRPAELFNGETALAWILRGRIADVADRYEAALLYQA
jgi:transcriptional regulator with XRE-family HTH domain